MLGIPVLPFDCSTQVRLAMSNARSKRCAWRDARDGISSTGRRQPNNTICSVRRRGGMHSRCWILGEPWLPAFLSPFRTARAEDSVFSLTSSAVCVVDSKCGGGCQRSDPGDTASTHPFSSLFFVRVNSRGRGAGPEEQPDPPPPLNPRYNFRNFRLNP